MVIQTTQIIQTKIRAERTMSEINMKAVGLFKYLPIDNEESLVNLSIEKPDVSGRNLLVAVKAISVNPVDTKVRAPSDQVEVQPRILGWDAAGEVISVGENVKHYQCR